MENEINGEIINILDEENGVILGKNEKEYTFSKRDFLTNFDLKIGQEVVFKPIVHVLEKKLIYKASMIDKK